MPAPQPKPLPDPEPPRSFLWSDDQMAEITDAEARGIYTAEGLERKWPNKFDAALRMLSDRWPISHIAKALNVAKESVVAVADKHGDKIRALDAQFANKARRCAWYQLDRAEKNPDIIPPQAIAQSSRYFFDIAQVADGRPTEIIEERKTIDIYEHWQAFVRGDTIGLSGEKIPPLNGELVADPAAALPAPGASAVPGDSGWRSEGSYPPTQGNLDGAPSSAPSEADQTILDRARAREAPEAGDTGGGIGGGDGGAEPWKDNGPQKILPIGGS